MKVAWLLALQGTHTCGVCLEELPGTHFVRPSPNCDHAFCGTCLHGLCAVHVAEGTLDALRCPLPECKAPFSRQARPTGPMHAAEHNDRTWSCALAIKRKVVIALRPSSSICQLCRCSQITSSCAQSC